MARGIRRRWRLLAPLLVISVVALNAPADEPRAAERFRAAAALQERVLYDLAAAEYAAIAAEFSADPLGQRAQLQHGMCLFQLARYDAARDELQKLCDHHDCLSAQETEQFFAFLGLAEYNLSHAAKDADRNLRLDAAINFLDEQLAQFPSGELAPRSTFYRAESLYARGRLDQAIAAYRELLAKYPQHPQRADALYALGVAEHEHSQFAAAVNAFDAFRNEFPQHPSAADVNTRRGDALLAIVETQFAAGHLSDALRTIGCLLAEFPESARVPRALLVRAAIEVKESNTAGAEATLDCCLARCTQADVAIEARLLRATVRHSRGDFAGGLADAEKVLATEPQRTAALHVRGLCELGLKRHTDAAKTLMAIVERDSTYPALDCVLYDLAWAAQEANEPARAIATYAKLIESCPDSPLAPECYFRVGDSYYAASRFAAAAASFQTTIETATDDVLVEKATHKLAWCHFELGDFAIAQATFEQQIADHSQGTLAADARIMAAECRYQRQSFAEALPLFVAAINVQGASASLHAMAIAHAALSAGQLHEWPRCLELAQRARREFPTSDWAADVHCERGVALYELGRIDDAQRELTAVAADNKGPLSLRAEFMLGQIHLARNQSDEAVRAFFKVAYGHGGPNAPATYHHWQAEAIYAAARVIEESERSESAPKLYQELVDHYPASPRTATARQSLDQLLQR